MKKLVTLSNIEYIKDFKKYNIDGIIIGLNNVSCRFNTYYNISDIQPIIDEGLDVYININRIIHEDNLIYINDILYKLKDYNISGIFFNDLSIITLAKQYNLLNKLIYNPDTLLTNKYDINFYMDYGLLSTVISKEITLDEILNILKVCSNQSLIIHGRLNMSYSKRQFIKSYLKYINLDHPINNNYNLSLIESTRDYKMPIIEDQYGCSIFTDFTLYSIDEYNILSLNNLGYGIIDDIFMGYNELIDTLKLYDNKIDKHLFLDTYQSSNYSTGYYYQETNLVK